MAGDRWAASVRIPWSAMVAPGAAAPVARVGRRTPKLPALAIGVLGLRGRVGRIPGYGASGVDLDPIR